MVKLLNNECWSDLVFGGIKVIIAALYRVREALDELRP